MEVPSPTTTTTTNTTTPLNPLAQPFTSHKSQPQPSSSSSSSSPPAASLTPAEIDIYNRFARYPFHQDAEFHSGLSSIFGHPDTPISAQEAEENADLVLQAQCFYFARTNELPTAIDPARYRSWLLEQQPSYTIHTSESSHAPPPPPPQTTTTPLSTTLPADPTPTEPQYPTSFSHIVDLITRNQPIPGIEKIPDTVLGTALSKPNDVPARRKPWEIAAAAEGAVEDNEQKDSEDGEDAQSNKLTDDDQTSNEERNNLNDTPYGGLLGPLSKVEAQTGVAWVETATRGLQSSARENVKGLKQDTSGAMSWQSGNS